MVAAREMIINFDNDVDYFAMAEDNFTMARVIWQWKIFQRWQCAIIKMVMEIPENVLNIVFSA